MLPIKVSIKKGHTNVVVIFCITQPILSAEVDADNNFCDSLVFISLSVTEVRGGSVPECGTFGTFGCSERYCNSHL